MNALCVIGRDRHVISQDAVALLKINMSDG